MGFPLLAPGAGSAFTMPARPAPPPRPAPPTRGPITPSLGNNSFKGPVPQTQISRPSAFPEVGNPNFGTTPTPRLGMAPGTAAPPSTSFPVAPGPNQGPSINPTGPPPARIQPSRPTNKFNQPDFKRPSPQTPKNPTPAKGPDLGTSLGGGAALGGLGVGAGAAAFGATPPGWLIGGGMLLGAAAAAALSNYFWPPPPGDGTEGAPQSQVIPVPPQPGQGGLVPGKQYRIFVFSVSGRTHDWRGYKYDFGGPVNDYLRNQWGPLIVNAPASFGTETTERDWSHWGQGIISHDELIAYSGGVAVGGLYIQDGSGGYSSRTISSFSYRLERIDGTSEEQDKIDSGFPPKPGVDQTKTTQNLSGGSPSPAPNSPPPVAPPNNTPNAPPTTAPPKPATPTPSNSPAIANPSAPTPSAPTTGAGTPSNATPTTGPAPSGGGGSQSGGQGSPAPTAGGGLSRPTDPGQIAALIAATSPGVAGLIGAINNSTQPKAPTPTGAPIKLPDNNSPTTGPDNRPTDLKDPEIIPGKKEWLQNSNNELIGVNQEFLDKNGNVLYSITSTTNNTTINNVTNQIDQSVTQQNTTINNIVNQINNPTPAPTTNTTVNNITQTEQITNNIENVVNNQTNTINQNTTNLVNNSTTTITETINNSTTTTNNQLVQLLEKSDVDLASTLAILGTLATAVALDQAKNQTLTAIGNIPTPTPCTYPAYHPQNQAERAAISGKVDGVNTVLGTVTNVQIAEARTGIANVANVIGSPVAGGAQTVLGGINNVQTFLGKFARSLRLDKVYNGLTLLVSLHNAAMLSRNLAETVGYFLDSGLQALNLKDENEEPLDLGQTFSTTVANFIKGIVGEEVFNGLSANWKKASAIYTSAINILDSVTAMLAGLAESMEIIGNYTGKIGNALKKGGVVLENAYNWMDDNLRLKTGRFAGIQKVVDGLNNAEDVVNNLTEVTDSINDSQELVNEIKKEWTDIKGRVSEGEGEKLTQAVQEKTVSQGSPVSKPDLITPED